MIHTDFIFHAFDSWDKRKTRKNDWEQMQKERKSILSPPFIYISLSWQILLNPLVALDKRF